MIINKKVFRSNINEKTELGINGHFLSPFGPQFLHLTLDDEIRVKLLQSVTNFRKDTSKLSSRIFIRYADRGFESQKNRWYFQEDLLKSFHSNFQSYKKGIKYVEKFKTVQFYDRD